MVEISSKHCLTGLLAEGGINEEQIYRLNSVSNSDFFILCWI